MQRVKLDRYVDDDNLVPVMKKTIQIPDQNGGNIREATLLFVTAGYKNEVLIGTINMYESGHMRVFNPGNGIWYNMNNALAHGGDFIAYIKNEGDNISIHCGKNTPATYRGELPDDGTIRETVLFTRIELVALSKLKKEAHKNYIERMRLYSYA